MSAARSIVCTWMLFGCCPKPVGHDARPLVRLIANSSAPSFQKDDVVTIDTIRFEPDGGDSASLFGVVEPGSYEMTVVYRMGDPWSQPSDVYAGETNQATVKFTIAH